MRWGYGGRRWSCDGEGGGGGELDAPRTKNGERGLGFAHRGCARDGGGGRTAMVGALGQRRSASDQTTARSRRALSGRARRGDSDSGDGVVRTALSGRQRAVPTAHLTRWSGVVRGSHAATARCQAGPARRLTVGTHSSAFSELKFHPG
jgi:hypothetical protein